MKIAITSQDRTYITDHAGHCQHFWIYEIAEAVVTQKTLIDVPHEQTFHEFAGPLPAHLQDVQVLIAGGMGQSLNQRLARNGIEGLVTAETQPDVAVSAYLLGHLPTIAPQQTACGFGEGHPHPYQYNSRSLDQPTNVRK